MTKISINIGTCNDSDKLINCIASILTNHDMSNKELVIVDDCSRKEESEKVSKYLHSLNGKADVKLIVHKENKGTGETFNDALSASDEDSIIVKLDADTLVIQKNFLDRLVYFLEEDNELGLVTCKTNTIGQPVQLLKIPDAIEEIEDIVDFLENIPVDIKYYSEKQFAFSGMCMAFRKSDCTKFDVKFDTRTHILLNDNIFYLDVLRKMKKKCGVAQKLYLIHSTNYSKGDDTPEKIAERRLSHELWEKEEL